MSLKNDWKFTENKLSLWSKLEALYHIVKAGSLVQAAKVLKTDQPTLSSKLATLEKKFGFKLINRSTPHKPLSLKRKGKIVFEAAQKTFLTMQMMDTQLSEDKNVLKGKIRLSTTNAIASYIVGPLLIDFAKENKDIEIELLGNDTDIDIFHNEVDLAIRPYISNTPLLEQAHTFKLQANLYASPDYLLEFGTPKTVRDLDSHQLLTFARAFSNPYSDVEWLLRIGREGQENRKPFYTSNNIENLLNACEKGLGIIPFYELMIKNRKPNFRKVLEGVKGPEVQFYLVFPKTCKV